jgi:hypothetical protein
MSDWICEACNGPLVLIGVLGQREHARCRACGLDHNRPHEEAEYLTEEDLENGRAQFNLFFPPIVTRPGDDIIKRVEEERDADRFANDMKPRP